MEPLFRFIYLPKIGDQIKKARNLFNRSIKKNSYKGKYHFCYCTKCNHFFHVVNEALKHKVNIETSSSFDINLVLSLYEKEKLNKNTIIIHNGYKTKDYLKKIIQLQELGFENSTIILDSLNEIEKIEALKNSIKKIKLGIRVAINEEAQSTYYTSRFGIPINKIVDLFEKKIKNNPNIELTMLHFFIDSGIKDTPYYWGEFQKILKVYCQLKAQSKTLNALNIGGGFPVRNHLGFEYNYQNIIDQIINIIKESCDAEHIPHPDIYTEFGKYTVGEAGAIIFEVIEEKKQNDTENWYIINNSLMNTVPDAWSIQEKFILLPINKWQNEYKRVNIGGISCDHSDYYNFEDFNQEVLLPQIEDNTKKEPLYIGFFHTGAYQDSVSGYGGIKHCLIPAPKHVILDRDSKGNIIDSVYREEQSIEEMFTILGYNK